MALQKDITDAKGVKTRYHAIHKFDVEFNKIFIKLYSYVNQKARQSELEVINNNKKAQEYEERLRNLHDELGKLTADVEHLEENSQKIEELSNQINALEMNPDRPKYQEFVDTHYDEDIVVLDYFEPITKSALYDAIAQTEKYKGATKL